MADITTLSVDPDVAHDIRLMRRRQDKNTTEVLETLIQEAEK